MEVQDLCKEAFRNEKTEYDQLENNVPAHLQSSVENIAKKEGFISHQVTSEIVSTNGGNYLAELYAIDIKGKTNKGDKEVNLFVKNIVATDTVSDFLTASDVYSTESFVYKDLAKLFKQVEDEVEVPAEERYKIVKGFDESSSEFIIMENVSRKGFKTCDRKEIPPLRFVELSIQQLAKLHGLGFVLKKFKPYYFDQTIMQLKYPVNFNDHYIDFYNKLANVCINNIRDDLKAKVKRLILTASKKLETYIRGTDTIRTLCHGDFRVLNIMMKEEEGEVTEIIPVDLQVIHYGCPANDILYFIAGCTDRQFRKSHFDNLIDLYYDTLKKYLKFFDINVNDVYPKKELEAAIETRRDYGLLIALMVFPLLFANEEEYPDLEKMELPDKLEPYVVKRIEEMVEDLDNLGLL